MTDEEKPALLDELSEMDALRLENLHLKYERANRAADDAKKAFNDALADAGRRYDFNPAKDPVYLDTRKIVRTP